MHEADCPYEVKGDCLCGLVAPTGEPLRRLLSEIHREANSTLCSRPKIRALAEEALGRLTGEGA